MRRNYYPFLVGEEIITPLIVLGFQNYHMVFKFDF